MPAVVHFGPAGRFELQVAEGRLLIDGQPAAVGRRALDLLVVLTGSPGHLLTKHELLARVWPGLVVEEANLQVQIANLRKLLGNDAIQTVPGRGYRFNAPIETAAPAAAPAPDPGSDPARQPASAAAAPRLYGREADLAALLARLADSRCVTLTGPAGVGKTSLARAVAARCDLRCVWVDLAPLGEGSQIAGALARAVGLSVDGDAQGHLLRALAASPTLLVLDNAEHVVDACAQLAGLVMQRSQATLLVTSQLPLGVAGEQVQRLEPLAPDAAPGAPAAELGDGALALLVARIGAADPRFVVGAEQLPLLHELCLQLDGLPLALEMAAARVPALGLRAVHGALAQRFSLLTRGHRDAAQRHRTLRGALQWSYELLSARERRLFRHLAVFTAGFTLDLAVALMTDAADERWEVIDALSALVDRSLVTVSHDDPPRYRLLETMRAYAWDRLADAGEAAAARSRLARALLAHVRGIPLQSATAETGADAEIENARDAIAWAQQHELDTAVCLIERVGRFATFTPWRAEVARWMDAMEPAVRDAAGSLSPGTLVAWWRELARHRMMAGRAGATEAARRAFEIARGMDGPQLTMSTAAAWVRTVKEPGEELDLSCDALRRSVALCAELPPLARLNVQGALASAASTRGDWEAALESRLAESALAEEYGLPRAHEAAESNVVLAYHLLGRHAEGAARGRALLARIDRDEGDDNGNRPWAMAGLLHNLVALGAWDEVQALAPHAWAAYRRFDIAAPLYPLLRSASAHGQHDTVALLTGYLLQHDAAPSPLDAGGTGALADARDAAAAALGDAAMERLVGAGRRLDAAAADALATRLGA